MAEAYGAPPHAGFLRKRGRLNVAFKRRYFALAGGVLTYCTDADQGCRRGAFDVRGAAVAAADGSARELVLTLKGAKRGAVVLDAETALLRDEWVAAIEAHSRIDPARPLTDEEEAMHAPKVAAIDLESPSSSEAGSPARLYGMWFSARANADAESESDARSDGRASSDTTGEALPPPETSDLTEETAAAAHLAASAPGQSALAVIAAGAARLADAPPDFVADAAGSERDDGGPAADAFGGRVDQITSRWTLALRALIAEACAAYAAHKLPLPRRPAFRIFGTSRNAAALALDDTAVQAIAARSCAACRPAMLDRLELAIASEGAPGPAESAARALHARGLAEPLARRLGMKAWGADEESHLATASPHLRGLCEACTPVEAAQAVKAFVDALCQVRSGSQTSAMATDDLLAWIIQGLVLEAEHLHRLDACIAFAEACLNLQGSTDGDPSRGELGCVPQLGNCLFSPTLRPSPLSHTHVRTRKHNTRYTIHRYHVTNAYVAGAFLAGAECRDMLGALSADVGATNASENGASAHDRTYAPEIDAIPMGTWCSQLAARRARSRTIAEAESHVRMIRSTARSVSGASLVVTARSV